MLLLVVSLPAVALADQCAWIPQSQAKEAKGVLTGKRVLEWCEPCDEARPKSAAKAVKVTRVDVRRTEGKLYELSVNGEAVDLAYLYVEVEPGRWRNVAKVVGCRTTGVKPELTLPVD